MSFLIDSEFFLEPLSEAKKRETSPARDLSKMQVPKNQKQLARWAKRKDPDEWVYRKLNDIFKTASSARGVVTPEDVQDFCRSYLEGTDLWEQMYRDGLQVESEERVRENFRMLGDTISNVRKESTLKKLFRIE